METRKQRCVIVCHCMHIHMRSYHMQFVCLGFQHITLSQIVADTRILLARFTKYIHSVYTNWLLLPTVAICEDWTRRTYQKLRVWSERLRMLDAIWKVNMILGGFLAWWVEGIESWQLIGFFEGDWIKQKQASRWIFCTVSLVVGVSKTPIILLREHQVSFRII